MNPPSDVTVSPGATIRGARRLVQSIVLIVPQPCGARPQGTIMSIRCRTRLPRPILSPRLWSSGVGLAMDLLQLEHFLAVVEERTFTRAAERVCRTQPAISQSIKKLEEEVGAPLFARDVHEVSLTEAGRVLADYARRMVHLRDEALRQVTELKSLKAGTLAIAAHES